MNRTVISSIFTILLFVLSSCSEIETPKPDKYYVTYQMQSQKPTSSPIYCYMLSPNGEECIKTTDTFLSKEYAAPFELGDYLRIMAFTKDTKTPISISIRVAKNDGRFMLRKQIESCGPEIEAVYQVKEEE